MFAKTVTTITKGTSPARRIGDVLVAVCMVAALAACQSSAPPTTASERTGPSERTGQYMDDSAMTTAVKTKLTTDGVANLTRINVTTNNGEVRLSGVVDTPEQKLQAGRLAGQVEGVRRVDNDIQVRQAEVSGKPDTVLQ